MGREIEADGDLLLTPLEAQFNRWHHEAEKLKIFPAFACRQCDRSLERTDVHFRIDGRRECGRQLDAVTLEGFEAGQAEGDGADARRPLDSP